VNWAIKPASSGLLTAGSAGVGTLSLGTGSSAYYPARSGTGAAPTLSIAGALAATPIEDVAHTRRSFAEFVARRRNARDVEPSYFSALLPATSAMLGSSVAPGYTHFVHGTVNPFVVYSARLQTAALGGVGGLGLGGAVMGGAESVRALALGAGIVAWNADNLQAAVRNRSAYTADARAYVTGSPIAGEVGNLIVGAGFSAGGDIALSVPGGGTPLVQQAVSGAARTARITAFRLGIEAAEIAPPMQTTRAAFVQNLHQVQLNAARGQAFHDAMVRSFGLGARNLSTEVSVRPFLDTGIVAPFRVRLDALGSIGAALRPGTTMAFEFKSSPTAGFTLNQRIGFPLLMRNGGVVVGAGGGEVFPSGTVLPPTPVRVIWFDPGDSRL